MKNNYTAIFCLFAFLLVQTASYSSEIFKLRDIKVKMKGFGKTVIDGRKIENFDVEILGILANNKVSENLLINGHSILVKVSGEVIDRAGGIAAGMSGSPVYIDDKIIGGISSGWIMTDHTVGLVTPIEEMLEIWEYPQLSCAPSDSITTWSLTEPIELAAKKIDTIFEVPYTHDVNDFELQPNQAIFKTAAPDIFFEGLTTDSVEHLIKQLNKKNIKTAQKIPAQIFRAAEISQFDAAADIFEPGSAIGIQLARGDINVTTLATLTHRKGHKILAMAHPFLKRGNVSFLMTGAYIYHSFSSVEMPFKIGASTEMIGTINQDREKGISGQLGKFPEMVPIQIDVFDKDLNLKRNINYQVVRDKSVFSMVLEATLIQALEGVSDREGGGTAQMGISIDCANQAKEQYSFRRENLFYSKNQIVQALVNEIGSLIDLIIENEIEEVMPTRLVLKIELESNRRTVSIEKVEIVNASIAGGGVLNAEITLKPFRSNSFVRKASITLPQDIRGETITLSVFGLNARIDDLSQPIDEKMPELRKKDTHSKDFDSAIRAWVNSPKNSDLIFQISGDGEDIRALKLTEDDYEIQPTNQLVIGRVDTVLTLSEE